MKSLRVLSLVAALSLFGVAQQANQVIAPTSSQVVVPHLIRFSGQAKDAAGKLMTGTVGITFTLHKGQQDETALWIETQNVQLDSTGKYTVLLGATKPEGIPAEMFTSGEAQWLGIRLENQPELPRVLLVSVPYALRAAEADTLAGHSPADFVTTDKLSSAVQQELQQQSTSSPNPGTGKKSAIKASTPTDTATNFIDSNTSQVVLVQQTNTGAALNAIATTGLAVTAKSTGTAIYGLSTGTGTSAGVEGVTSSPAGRGLYGFNTATTGENFGVVGAANSTQGIGVFGSNGATTGSAVGVWGTTTSPGGVALKGTATGATGATTGVLGTVKSPTGTALVLQSTGSGPLISGQSGSSNTQVFSVDGSGNVSGGALSAKTPAGMYGVYGQQNALSTEYTNCCTSYSAGVWGDTTSVSTAILATADNANGVQANNNSSSYAAGFFENDYASGTSLVLAAIGAGGNCDIYTNGNLSCTGTVSGSFPTADKRTLEMYGVQATENWYEDAGSASLNSGTASIRFDPNFMEAVNTSIAYQVFLTPKGDCKGLYVSSEGPNGFDVHELGGGNASIAFDYRIMAKRKGQERLRMEDVTERQKKLAKVPALKPAGAARINPSVVSGVGQQQHRSVLIDNQK